MSSLFRYPDQTALVKIGPVNAQVRRAKLAEREREREKGKKRRENSSRRKNFHHEREGERERRARERGGVLLVMEAISVARRLTKRFCASLKHNKAGQNFFIKPNSKR